MSGVMPPTRTWITRTVSPPTTGSTLMTSAPWSARSIVASGPETAWEKSTMR